MFTAPQKTTRLEVVGEQTGQNFEGDFTFKLILTIREQHDHQLLLSRLLGDIEFPSRALQSLAVTRALLQYHLVDSPLWWKESDNGANLFDVNVLFEIHTLYLEALKEYHASLKKIAEEKK